MRCHLAGQSEHLLVGREVERRLWPAVTAVEARVSLHHRGAEAEGASKLVEALRKPWMGGRELHRAVYGHGPVCVEQPSQKRRPLTFRSPQISVRDVLVL